MNPASNTTYKAVRSAPQEPSTPRAAVPPPASYLGPGHVTSVHGAGVDVVLSRAPQSTVTARMALAQPYEPVPGDELLLLGDAEGFYVVGVLAGQGRTELTFKGDVKLHAVGGTMELCGDAGLKLASPEVTIAAGELKTFARATTEKVGTAYRWIKERLTFRAGEVRRTIDGKDVTHAQSSTTLAKDVVKIDAGGSVQLGH